MNHEYRKRYKQLYSHAQLHIHTHIHTIYCEIHHTYVFASSMCSITWREDMNGMNYSCICNTNQESPHTHINAVYQ